ncbi:MAG TPA: hypothetical protein VF666_14195 [Pyrinomonadaceae bacterium]|jgi:hypothetical protein
MRKSFDLQGMLRTGFIALCLALGLSAMSATAQNNANTATTQNTQATNSTSTRTTTSTSQTAPAGGQTTTVETRRETYPSPILWVVIVAVIALLAIAFIAMRKRGDRNA